ncbi:T9SS type A sorting domain-containing protein [candidate division KSB1 bacterium]|nr:T9SS type A sorting domain-containing protein [candidate division KSB1 bacterium]
MHFILAILKYWSGKIKMKGEYNVFTKKSKTAIWIMVLVLFFAFTHKSLAQKPVSGAVWGKWTLAESPYWVIDDIHVPEDSALIIEEGVEVEFVGAWSFSVWGLLQAKGTEENRITFHGDGGAGDWKDIYFAQSALPGCILDYCIVKDGGYKDSVDYYTKVYTNIFICNNDSNVTISHCEVSNSAGDGIHIKAFIRGGAPVDIIKKCSPTIAKNKIYSNKENGIKVQSLYSNWNKSGRSCSSITSPQIKNNLIYNNGNNAIACKTDADGSQTSQIAFIDSGIKVKTNPIIQQNTIYGNAASGIFCDIRIVDHFSSSVFETNPSINSNIISNSNGYGLNANNLVETKKIKSNCFWSNDSANFKGINGGLGTLSRTNKNNDPCDGFLNIFFDPEYVDASNDDFYLMSTSKCIDAGDLGLPWDDDGSYPDIGAFPYKFPLNYGDVDLNGEIQNYDASQILKYLVGLESLNYRQQLNSNVSLDTTISALDATLILQYSTGLIDSLPYSVTPPAYGDIVMIDEIVYAGQNIAVPIHLFNGENILAFNGNIEFNPKHLAFESVSLSDQLKDFRFEQKADSGAIKIAGAGALPAGESGTFLTLNFTVRNDSNASETIVYLQELRWNEECNLKHVAMATLKILSTNVEMCGCEVPTKYALNQNFPNPFNPETSIRYQLPVSGMVKLIIYNSLGQQIRTLTSKNQTAGYHQVSWDGKDERGEPVSSGIYLYRLTAGEYVQVKKMLLMH